MNPDNIRELEDKFRLLPVSNKQGTSKIKQIVTEAINSPLSYSVEELAKSQIKFSMATATISDIRNFIDGVPEYDGEVKTLPEFIKETDNFYTVMNTLNLTAIQKTYCFSMLKKKFTHKARDILSTQEFKSWEEIKTYLQNNFEDKSTYITMLLTLLRITHTNDINNTLEKFKTAYHKITSKIALLTYKQEEKKAITTEIQTLITTHFISLIPLNLRTLFISKNIQTLDECEQILTNEFNFTQVHKSPLHKINNQSNIQNPFLKQFNPPPRKFPGQEFPSKPFNPQLAKPSGKQMFARQNIKNGIETRQQFKPTPMSGMTRTTIPMSTQTIKRNYALETQDPEDTCDNEINDENETNDQDETFDNQSFLDYDPDQTKESM